MIERVIEASARFGLRGFVASEARHYVEDHDLKLSIVTNPVMYEYWEKELHSPFVWLDSRQVERISHVRFLRNPPITKEGRLYVVEVSLETEEKIRPALHHCEDIVWIVRFSY